MKDRLNEIKEAILNIYNLSRRLPIPLTFDEIRAITLVFSGSTDMKWYIRLALLFCKEQHCSSEMTRIESINKYICTRYKTLFGKVYLLDISLTDSICQPSV